MQLLLTAVQFLLTAAQFMKKIALLAYGSFVLKHVIRAGISHKYGIFVAIDLWTIDFGDAANQYDTTRLPGPLW